MVVRFVISVVVALQLLLAVPGSALAQQSSPPLSLVSPRAQGDAPPRERGLVRSRPLVVDKGVLAGVGSGLFRAPDVGQPVVISFFDDVSVAVVFTRAENMGDGTTAFYGTVPGVPFGSAVLVEADGIVAANVVVPDRMYQIRFRGSAGHEAREVDPSVFRDHDDDATPLPQPAGDPAPAKAATTILDDGSKIDVMVVYTPAARAAAGGTVAMKSQIALGIAETNGAYTNSAVIQRLRLVHSAEVAYSESGDMRTDLPRLQGAADGFMDNVHALRDSWGADLVSLWVENGGGYCGIGYGPGTVSSSNAPWGFNVVARDCATGYFTFGHELGHNMGLNHDVYVSAETTPFAYAHGYVDVGQRFRTVMAYDSACAAIGVSCTLIQHFSNPDVKFNGFATGSAATANNRLALDNTRVAVANYRAAIPDGCTLDLDGNGVINASTDGLLLIRAMLGLTGTAVTKGAIGAGAKRTDWAAIQPMISYARLDVDGNGDLNARTDGLMIMRAMLGLTGTAVTKDAIGTGIPARTTWAEIRTYLNTTCGSSFAR